MSLEVITDRMSVDRGWRIQSWGMLAFGNQGKERSAERLKSRSQ